MILAVVEPPSHVDALETRQGGNDPKRGKDVIEPSDGPAVKRGPTGRGACGQPSTGAGVIVVNERRAVVTEQYIPAFVDRHDLFRAGVKDGHNFTPIERCGVPTNHPQRVGAENSQVT